MQIYKENLYIFFQKTEFILLEGPEESLDLQGGCDTLDFGNSCSRGSKPEKLYSVALNKISLK